MIELRFCRNCESPISGRLDKKYCSGNCRKRSSECKQNSKESKEKRNKNYPQLTDHYFTGEYPVKPIDELGDDKITQLSLLSTASNN